jgi:hypothetical protein
MKFRRNMSGAIDEGKAEKIHSGLKYFDPVLIDKSSTEGVYHKELNRILNK